MRILIAEDDYTSRLTLTTMLKKNGHEVVQTVNGAEAWEELQKPDAPRLVLLDWMMPEIEGVEVVRLIRARESQILLASGTPPARHYLIMLTAKTGRADVVAGLNIGADDYIPKPVYLDELTARVNVGIRMILMQEQLVEQIQKLRDAYDQIKTLQGILPICMHCKNIRDDSGYWKRIEEYVTLHSETSRRLPRQQSMVTNLRTKLSCFFRVLIKWRRLFGRFLPRL